MQKLRFYSWVTLACVRADLTQSMAFIARQYIAKLQNRYAEAQDNKYHTQLYIFTFSTVVHALSMANSTYKNNWTHKIPILHLDAEKADQNMNKISNMCFYFPFRSQVAVTRLSKAHQDKLYITLFYAHTLVSSTIHYVWSLWVMQIV